MDGYESLSDDFVLFQLEYYSKNLPHPSHRDFYIIHGLIQRYKRLADGRKISGVGSRQP